MTGFRATFATLRNGEALALARVPRLPLEAWRRDAIAAVAEGARVASLFADHAPDGGDGVDLHLLLADDISGALYLAATRVSDARYPALTPDCTQVQLFEREIREQYGVEPEGHPWLKPVRFAAPLPGPAVGAARHSAPPAIGVMDFYRVDGEEVHEVAVGPVHAGVIEPGHFRFQCHGEHVFHLEISLGYQHRGIERALLGGPHKQSVHQIETTAGDTSIGHAWAYSQALEALSGMPVPARAHALRSVALELERLANHTGDLGALANDIGYLPTAAYCGRIRGDFLNLTALLSGSRFGRGFVRPGGTGFDVEPRHAAELLSRLRAAETDVCVAVELLWETSSVMARFENVGILTKDACQELGIVGPAARASGVVRDVRHDHPTGIYRFTHIPVATAHGGDVGSRAFVRWLEIQQSIAYIRERIESLPEAAPAQRAGVPAGALAPESVAVSLVEGWRGEICHVAITDAAGRFRRYKIVDPSFHNWMGLALAMRDQQISDFPLCNKSFNLSYCGFDL